MKKREPNTNKQTLKFGGCVFKRGAYVKVIALRKSVHYLTYGVEIVDIFTGTLYAVHDDTIEVLCEIDNPVNEHKYTVPIEDIKEVYTLHVPYSLSKFVSWVRRKVANHYNKKMLKHTRKTLYELHKY